MTEPRWATMNLDASLPRRAPSLAEQSYDVLKSWVVNGDLEPATVLSENDLSRRLDISRSPLREAIRALQDEGLLEPSGPRGFRVPPLDVDLIQQVYGVRLALESAAAANCGPIPDAELAEAEAQLTRIEAAMATGDLEPFNTSDFDFHDLFISRCGNPLLIKHIHRLRGNVQRIINFAGHLPRHTEVSFREHQVMFEAMQCHDPAALQDAVVAHITGVRERLIARLTGEGPESV